MLEPRCFSPELNMLCPGVLGHADFALLGAVQQQVWKYECAIQLGSQHHT